MEHLRGYPIRVERACVAGRAYELLVPASGESLLDDPRVAARFERDEFMPYWAWLWSASRLLAAEVAKWGPPAAHDDPPTLLELGCGLGLVGLVAAGLGYRVIMSDYDEDALAFAAENARRNGVAGSTTRLIDWRETYDDLRVERIVAADVLYESRNLRPVAGFVQRHLAAGGFALLSDPNRSTADSFERVARQSGLSVCVERVALEPEGGALPVTGRVYHLRHA
jgi:predicted nicotinamide N-methyase